MCAPPPARGVREGCVCVCVCVRVVFCVFARAWACRRARRSEARAYTRALTLRGEGVGASARPPARAPAHAQCVAWGRCLGRRGWGAWREPSRPGRRGMCVRVCRAMTTGGWRVGAAAAAAPPPTSRRPHAHRSQCVRCRRARGYAATRVCVLMCDGCVSMRRGHESATTRRAYDA